MIPVAEIFGPTIQGEGPNTGIKTLFIRVMGCDFHCDGVIVNLHGKRMKTLNFILMLI